MSKRPNILWISFEDSNPCYGCYGDKVAQTPNVDQLAAEGCIWPNAYSSAPVCAPARAGVITGMYAISVGAQHMRTSHEQEGMPGLPTPYSAVLPAHVKCFSEYLRAEGYFCTNNIKTDYQFETPLTAWDELGFEAHWRNRPDHEQPFFAVFNFEQSHESNMWEENCKGLVIDPADVELPPYFPDTPRVREAMARMHSNIASNDQRLGELLRQLEEDGLAENTIVCHWSDHGPLPRGKRWLYDSGLHVPMIVRWPGQLEPGTVNESLVSTIDLAPTMMSAIGMAPPRHLHGQVFFGPHTDEPRQYIYASRDRLDSAYDRVRCARDERYKYIRNYFPEKCRAAWQPYMHQHPIMQEIWRLRTEGKLNELQEELFFAPSRAPEELYDTHADPHELNDLSADPKFTATLSRLRDSLDSWLREVGDMSELNEFEMVRRWYPDGKQPQTTAPLPVVVDVNHPGVDFYQSEEHYQAPAWLMLESSTEGASIAWRYADDSRDHWRLYTQPIQLNEGAHRITAKAIRIGYINSEAVSINLDLKASSKTKVGNYVKAGNV
ncbi:sulfatase-like hydrolase/transferase [Cerasicoccus fimbriatus]|uniref:sulfatase-like hydrolase/transferase n=1 Tax=Cerasicoccus fimbriatus TaxID=3014554 RepID=UPI0022B4F074|nr:sulfatase-like hydrolase/transferase [Cerasicoccus sp. TK19100]